LSKQPENALRILDLLAQTIASSSVSSTKAGHEAVDLSLWELKNSHEWWCALFTGSVKRVAFV
jgi:hypothetical protein